MTIKNLNPNHLRARYKPVIEIAADNKQRQTIKNAPFQVSFTASPLWRPGREPPLRQAGLIQVLR